MYSVVCTKQNDVRNRIFCGKTELVRSSRSEEGTLFANDMHVTEYSTSLFGKERLRSTLSVESRLQIF
jgi:hypothetical protein